MDSKNREAPKAGAGESGASSSLVQNPWNLIFRPRNRSNSEHSISSVSSTASTQSTQSTQSGTSNGSLQRQTSNRNNDEYLWMVWRS